MFIFAFFSVTIEWGHMAYQILLCIILLLQKQNVIELFGCLS